MKMKMKAARCVPVGLYRRLRATGCDASVVYQWLSFDYRVPISGFDRCVSLATCCCLGVVSSEKPEHGCFEKQQAAMVIALITRTIDEDSMKDRRGLAPRDLDGMARIGRTARVLGCHAGIRDGMLHRSLIATVPELAGVLLLQMDYSRAWRDW